MAKRQTDTDKWKKRFMQGLPAAYKLLWLYLCDECDHSGIWHVDFKVAQIRVGEDMAINEGDALRLFEGRVIPFDDGEKWFIPGFLEIQYGEDLDEKNRVHKSVISRLKKYGLWNVGLPPVLPRSSENKGHVRPLEGPKDKDQDKDKDKDKEGECEGGQTPEHQPTPIAYFQNRYIEKVGKRVLLRKEDADNCRELVRTYGRVETMVAIDRYFAEADDFTKRKGYPFYLFFKQAPQYFAGSPPKSNPDQAQSPPPPSGEAWRQVLQGPHAKFHELVRRAVEQVGWEKIQDEDEHTRNLARAKFFEVYQWVQSKANESGFGKKMR